MARHRLRLAPARGGGSDPDRFLRDLSWLRAWAELPLAADPADYAIGFVLATGLIHLLGIGVGLLVGRLWQGRVSQALGGVIAIGGIYYLVT